MIFFYALAVNAIWFIIFLIDSMIDLGVFPRRQKTRSKKSETEKTERENLNYREAFRWVRKGEYGYAMQEMVKAPKGYKDREELLKEWVPKAMEKGLEHYRNGDLFSALGSFKGIIDFDPDNEEAQAYSTIVSMIVCAQNGGDLKYPVGSY